MSEDERVVRAAWDARGVEGLCLYEAKRSYHLRLASHEIKGTVSDKEAVWSAGRKYTDEHREKIRQVREEIALLRSMAIILRSEPEDLTAPVYERTIARLRAVLDDLLKGWGK
jgi:hypothetical protein